MSREISAFARELGMDEITIRTQLQRGYRRNQLSLIYAGSDTPEKVAGEAIEASIKRHYEQYGRLPCGEDLRVVDGTDQKAIRKYEHEVWRSFQFETGTDGDSLVSGGGFVE